MSKSTTAAGDDRDRIESLENLAEELDDELGELAEIYAESLREERTS